MAGCHQQRADHDRARATEHAIGQQSAEDGCEINQTGVKPEDRRRKRLNGERSAIKKFEKMTKRNESGDVLDVRSEQQLFHHVENQQRLHSVVRKTFPCFGERDVTEPARMPKETAVLGVMHERRVLRPASFGKPFG